MEINDKMDKTIDTLKKHFSSIRAGRANGEMLSRIRVMYYGSEVPLKQMASINVADSRTLIVVPFDKGAMVEIEKAISKSELGITPMSDGNNIRLTIPMMTEERRKDLDRQLRKDAEEARVALRNIRRDILEKNKKEELSEDEQKHKQTEIQKITDSYIGKIDNLLKTKIDEIMEV